MGKKMRKKIVKKTGKKVEKNSLKKFGIRECSVRLSRLSFSRIKIKCSAYSSEEGVQLKCNLTQEAANNFVLKVKREKKVKSVTTKILLKKALRKISKKPKSCEHLEKGEIILCKLRGYCEWPAIVVEFEKNSVQLEFFGDHTTCKTSLKNCYKFEDSSEIILNNLVLKKTPLYAKAIKEAEAVLNIPCERSIFNQLNLKQ